MADESKTSGSETTFRRIVVTEFGGPEVLTLATATASGLAPGDGQVLVRIAYAGVNPVDTCTCRELSSQALVGKELRTCQFTRVMRVLHGRPSRQIFSPERTCASRTFRTLQASTVRGLYWQWGRVCPM